MGEAESRENAAGLQALNDQGLPKLGEYDVLAELAKGGMGRVYLARRTGQGGFERLFAVKVLNDDMVDEPEALLMLLDEANIASRLHHPNVVPIIDIGQHERGYFLVMEYVDGCSMSQLLRRHKGSRPARLVIPMLIDALRGLHAAHELTDNDGNPSRLVHRDFSPHNLLVGVDGNCRVTDFGIAKVEARFVNTLAGLNKGKLAYMAPEQLAAAKDIDRRADIWAAGVVLAYALTGEHPFRGDSEATTTRNILRRDAVAPSGIGLKPPACFDEVYLKAVSREREKRYATAIEMADALHQIAVKHDLLGSPSEVSEWVRRLFKKDFDKRREVIRELRSKRDEGGGRMPVLPRLTLPGPQAVTGISSSAFTPSSGSKAESASAISAVRTASPQPPVPFLTPLPKPFIPPPPPLPFPPPGKPAGAAPPEARPPSQEISVQLDLPEDEDAEREWTPPTPAEELPAAATAASSEPAAVPEVPLPGPPPSPPALAAAGPARRRPVGLIAGVAGAVVIVGVLTVLGLSGAFSPMDGARRGAGDDVARAGVDRGPGPDGGAGAGLARGDGGSKAAPAAETSVREAGPAAPAEAGAAGGAIRVELRGLPGGSKIRVDGDAVGGPSFPVPADGFEHVIRVDAPGFVQWVHKLTPTPGAARDVVLDVEAARSQGPAKTPPPATPPTKAKLVRDPGF